MAVPCTARMEVSNATTTVLRVSLPKLQLRKKGTLFVYVKVPSSLIMTEGDLLGLADTGMDGGERSENLEMKEIS